MRLHNDEPTLLDQLDRLKLVRRIGDDVATCALPHVFGIHGDWDPARRASCTSSRRTSPRGLRKI